MGRSRSETLDVVGYNPTPPPTHHHHHPQQDKELRQYLLDNQLHDEHDDATIQSIIALTHNNVEAADDTDNTVSRAELSAHLHSLATHHIVEWVSHGLQLPQYAPAFRKHSITAFDLPHLTHGKTLQEMGITMALHRQRVLRGVKRLLLGLGSPPSAPVDVHCTDQANNQAIQWAPPLQAGSPPFHKYVVEVLEPTGGTSAGRWQLVNGALTSDDRGVAVGNKLGNKRAMYRVRAWNEYGTSEAAVVECGGTADSWWSGAWVSTLGVVLLSIVARSAYMLGWLDWAGGQTMKAAPQQTNGVGTNPLPRVASAVSSAASDPLPQQHVYTYSASFGSSGSGERFVVPPYDDDVTTYIKKPSVCAYEECTSKTLIPVLRIKARGTHYCGVCQRYYCAAHTAVSAHGASGDCGVESKCVCVGCLDEMDNARRQEVLRRQRRGSLSDRRGSGILVGGSKKSVGGL